MLRIEVYINRKRVAVAEAVNVHGDMISNYVCSATTEANPFSGSDKRCSSVAVTRHRRAQSVWALVEKMASAFARDDRDRDAYLAGRSTPTRTTPDA